MTKRGIYWGLGDGSRVRVDRVKEEAGRRGRETGVLRSVSDGVHGVRDKGIQQGDNLTGGGETGPSHGGSVGNIGSSLPRQGFSERSRVGLVVTLSP